MAKQAMAPSLLERERERQGGHVSPGSSRGKVARGPHAGLASGDSPLTAGPVTEAVRDSPFWGCHTNPAKTVYLPTEKEARRGAGSEQDRGKH